jgi:uncharacterized damage-inducible protein DinB
MPLQSHLSRQLLTVLQQGRGVLGDLAGLTDRLENRGELYRASPRPISTSSVGEHFRHILDAIECMVDGVDGGKIDYDRRERDEVTERDPSAAIARVEKLERVIQNWESRESKPLRVRADAPDGAPGAEGEDGAGWIDSTVDREIVYLVNHTIHHYALIAMILRHLGVEPDQDFGVAPSTLRYWKEVGRCAPQAG